MGENKRVKRRSFLKGSAGGLAAISALPGVLKLAGCSQQTAGPQAAPAPAAVMPSRKITLGLIGCGDLGRRHHLAGPILHNERFQVAAVCDVDANHRDEAVSIVRERTGRRPAAYEDFRRVLDRKDIDAVVVVTPDHWHALICVAAMEAGKDIYCEKPLTLTIDEGRKMVAAARRYGTVFQTGSMQRSDLRFRQAVALVRNGKIGTLKTCHTYIGACPEAGWEPYTTPPAGLNWDFWLGPAPYVEYFPGRCHYQFRWFKAYSGGKLTDWGAHHNDQVQWALDMDTSGPVEVEGKGTFFERGPYDVPHRFDVIYRYANGVELHCHSDGENGVRYEGTDGWIFVNRGRIEASDPEILKIDIDSLSHKVYNTGPSPDNWVNHYANWIECMETRRRCICDVEVGHRSCTVCHIGNIAIELGRPLRWDPAREEFVDDPAANRYLSRPMRPPWHL